MMNLQLTEAQKELKVEITNFYKSNKDADLVIRDRQSIFDKNFWIKSGSLKLQGLTIPSEYGGRGLDIISTMVALEALGYACEDNGLSFSIGAHFLACVVPIWLYGTNDQKESLLPNLCNGKSIIANAMTEPNSGSDAFHLNSSAIKNNDGYILNG